MIKNFLIITILCIFMSGCISFGPKLCILPFACLLEDETYEPSDEVQPQEKPEVPFNPPLGK